MSLLIVRLAIVLIVLAWGITVMFRAGDKVLGQRDPALRHFRILLIPELLYAASEAIFLGFSVITVIPVGLTSGLLLVARVIQLLFGPCYILFYYRHLVSNGMTLFGYVPFRAVIALTAANYLIFALQFPFPGLESGVRMINMTIVGSMMLYAGLCAVGTRWKKPAFLTSTKGGYWIAVFCLTYFPFVGLSDMLCLSVSFLDSGRPVSLQLFPFRELVILLIISVHFDPVYSHFNWAKGGPPQALSSREIEIAGLLREGATNKHIAENLHISLSTVKTHVASVIRKYGAGSREELLRLLTEDGERP